MKNFLSIFLIGLSFSLTAYSQQNDEAFKWTVQKPFDQNAFIENKGQFNQDTIDLGSPILFYTKKGKVIIYFTSSSIVFEYDSLLNNNTANKEQDCPKYNLVPYSFKMTWDSSNVNPKIDAINQLDNYYTFPNPKDKTGKSCIKANAWSKLIYHNVYNGIDLMFYYPKEGGIEYDVIIHPGADISAFKTKYTGAVLNLSNDNLIITSSFGNFTVHQPSSGKCKDGSSVKSRFKLDGNEVSLNTEGYDKKQLLIIDPWTTSTTFTGTNEAYDLDYDNQGNVYVYGGGANTEYQLLKYNNLGVLQWTYTTTPFTCSEGGYYSYGDLTVDHRNGTTYLVEGFDPNTGSKVLKINTLGFQTALYPGDTIANEMWRVEFDYCYNQIIIGAGNNSMTYQACRIDTSLITLKPLNVLGATDFGHDMTFLALDGLGNAFMATAKSKGWPTYFNNIILSMPLPSLSPTKYKKNDGYGFVEVASIFYYPYLSPTYAGNGFNGMAVNKNILATYDGATLKTWRSLTGANLDSISILGTPFSSGGIDMNCLGDIFIGNNSTVQVYDSSLTFKSSIPFTNTIYDLKLASSGILYVCGNGFVSAVSVPYDSICTATTGINSSSNINLINLYPNPSNGLFTIMLSGINCKSFVEIYNTLGEKIYTRLLTASNTLIDISNNAPGIYLYRVITETGQLVSAGKFVKE